MGCGPLAICIPLQSAPCSVPDFCHIACRECILEALTSTQSCPNCRALLPPASLVEGTPAPEGSDAAEADNGNQEPSNVKATSESKLLVLLSEVKHPALIRLLYMFTAPV